jgi:hypothetical protein
MQDRAEVFELGGAAIQMPAHWPGLWRIVRRSARSD